MLFFVVVVVHVSVTRLSLLSPTRSVVVSSGEFEHSFKAPRSSVCANPSGAVAFEVTATQLTNISL